MPEIDRPKQLAFELDEPKPKLSLSEMLDAFNYIPQGVRRAVRPLPLHPYPPAEQNQPRAFGGLVEREQRVGRYDYQAGMAQYQAAVVRANAAADRIFQDRFDARILQHLANLPPPLDDPVPAPAYPGGIYEVPNHDN